MCLHAKDKPVPLRLRKDGPLVAPIFTIRDPAGARRQIRYLACEVTASMYSRDAAEAAQAYFESNFQRGETPEEMQEFAQGRVWSGTRAAGVGLVDTLGGVSRAVALAKAAAPRQSTAKRAKLSS